MRPPNKLNVAFLSLPAHRHHFGSELAQHLASPPVVTDASKNAYMENRWCQIGDTVQPTAPAVLDRPHRQNQDRFDDNDAATSNLLAERNRLHIAYINSPTNGHESAYYRSFRLVRHRLQEMREVRTARKVEDRNEQKNFAAVRCPTAKPAAHLSVDDSILIIEKT
nr:unnamed protein product [Spirometra erinaceieuropaei]